MSEVIKQIDGLFTNADQEDIPLNFATVLKNLKPTNGKLVKTFGIGDKFDLDVIDVIKNSYLWDDAEYWVDGKYWIESGASITPSIGTSIDNILTYFNENLATPTGSGEGFVFIAVIISTTVSTLGLITLKFFDGNSWEDISNLLQNTLGSYYHKNQVNPVIDSNGILRILPGNAGMIEGTLSYEAKGIWIGYIDRNYFDEIYLADTDYTAGFYNYATEIIKPDISSEGLNLVATEQAGGIFNPEGAGEIKYYKFSYVYDGIVESLLSEEKMVNFSEDTFLQVLMTIDTTAFNKRITAIKVYRSDTGNDGKDGDGLGEATDNIDGSYNFVHTINFIRNSLNYTNGLFGLSGKYYIYCKDASFTLPDPLGSGWLFYIAIGGSDLYQVLQPSVDNQKVFTVIKRDGSGETYVTGEHDSDNWMLKYLTSPSDTIFTNVDNGTKGYAGSTYMILDEGFEFQEDILVGSLLKFGISTIEYRVISLNDGRAVKLATAPSSPAVGNYDWSLLRVGDGLYYFKKDGTDINVYFFDTKLTEGAAFSLLNSPSIKVNGKFAITHLGRLWQFNVILDPGGENEAHDDWLSYSELNQYDVNPVSNVIPITDRESSKGTGLAVSFGSIILLKRNSVFKLIIPDISTPTGWYLSESIFSRGNVAPRGYIQVGHIVYICATDGIYELDVNFQAASDDTPLINSRISEPINDIYLSLNDISEKPNIVSVYDKITTEIIYQFAEDSLWAFNVTTKQWRQIVSAIDLDLVTYDENGNGLVYDDATTQIYSFDKNEDVGVQVRTKVFDISRDDGASKGLCRYLNVTYKSAVQLSLKLYADDAAVAVATKTLAIASTITTVRLAFRYWAYNIKVEIIDSTTNGNSIEIYKMSFESD